MAPPGRRLLLPLVLWTGMTAAAPYPQLSPNHIPAVAVEAGCQESNGAVPITNNIVACNGTWTGHVRRGTKLCARGFSICTWKDRDGSLVGVSWSVATSLRGCFAFDAAQDGDSCVPCKNDMESDDLAGLGRDCPHQNWGQGGCLPGGRVDASCCLDADHLRACRQRPGITGVLCCRRKEPPSKRQYAAKDEGRVLGGPVQSVRETGERLHVHCPLPTRPNDRVLWTHNGRPMGGTDSASLDIPFASPEHSGLYICRKLADPLAKGHLNLTVRLVKTSACADGTSEGFHRTHNVRGCAGKWTGHVRRGSRSVCGAGWRVCNPRDRPFLDKIDLDFLRDFAGCFAYNAADTRKRCRRCKNHLRMAALGGDCPVQEKVAVTSASCFRNRHIQAYSDKGGGCQYQDGRGLTGVLCCRKWSMRQQEQMRLRHRHQRPLQKPGFVGDAPPTPTCFPACRNGATCLPDGRCLCPTGFHGARCQHGGCVPRCLNGGQCISGFCRCESLFYGQRCQQSRRVWLGAPKGTEATTRVQVSAPPALVPAAEAAGLWLTNEIRPIS